EREIDDWMRRLTQLRDLLSDEKVAAVLTNPTIPIEQRMDVITSASLDPETTNLAKLLIEANRVREIGAVADQFENLADDAAGRVRATITTAVKLAPRDRDRVAIQLSERLGKTVTMRLEFPRDTYGLALNLEEDQVRAVILGEYGHLHEGDEVRTTGRLLEVPVGDELIGRVVNPLGQPIDGKGPIKTSKTLPIEKIAPGVITRKRV